MKTSKSNLKQPIIFAKIIAVSIAVFLLRVMRQRNGKRLAKARMTLPEHTGNTCLTYAGRKDSPLKN